MGGATLRSLAPWLGSLGGDIGSELRRRGADGSVLCAAGMMREGDRHTADFGLRRQIFRKFSLLFRRDKFRIKFAKM